MAMLEVKDLNVYYGMIQAIKGISFEVNQGEVIALIGANGAGKTTFIKELIEKVFAGEKLVLIENEFGEIGIDGGFLKESGIQINEMNSGCICCSLVGDFGSALKEVVTQYNPDRIIIEPSGVGKLSDVIKAVQGVAEDVELDLNSFVTVADAKKCKMYMKNFGEFYNNQVESAHTIVLSRTQNMKQDKLEACVAMIREHNKDAAVITTPWDELTGEQLLAAMEKPVSLADMVMAEEEICPVCGGHHDHDHEDHDHEHHHHHHADDVFTSFGSETVKKFSQEELTAILNALADEETYGMILRAKGMLESDKGEWLYFDMVPQEHEIRIGAPTYTGRFCVIGSKLNEDALKQLFHVE